MSTAFFIYFVFLFYLKIKIKLEDGLFPYTGKGGNCFPFNKHDENVCESSNKVIVSLVALYYLIT